MAKIQEEIKQHIKKCDKDGRKASVWGDLLVALGVLVAVAGFVALFAITHGAAAIAVFAPCFYGGIGTIVVGATLGDHAFRRASSLTGKKTQALLASIYGLHKKPNQSVDGKKEGMEKQKPQPQGPGYVAVRPAPPIPLPNLKLKKEN